MTLTLGFEVLLLPSHAASRIAARRPSGKKAHPRRVVSPFLTQPSRSMFYFRVPSRSRWEHVNQRAPVGSDKLQRIDLPPPRSLYLTNPATFYHFGDILCGIGSKLVARCRHVYNYISIHDVSLRRRRLTYHRAHTRGCNNDNTI